MYTGVTNANPTRHNLLKAGAKILAVLLIAAALVWVGRSSVKTKIVETQVVREVKVSLDESKLLEIKNDIISTIRAETNSVSKGSYVAAGKTNSTSTTKVTETIKTIYLDPATGKVIKQEDVNRVVDSGKEKTKETTASGATENTTTATTTTNVVDNSTSTEATDTHVESTDVTKVTQKVTEKPAGGDVPEPSPIGLAINSSLRPMITYDVMRLKGFDSSFLKIPGLAANVNAEINTKKLGISAVGVGLTMDINKRRDYFAGIYGQYSFEQRETEIGVLAGRRF